jgi:HEAT repeat protein
MPSERYYRQQAAALLSWARATHDRGWARFLRQRAAYELERAADEPTAVTDLNPLLADFNEQQLRKVIAQDFQMVQPSREPSKIVAEFSPRASARSSPPTGDAGT